MSFRPLGFLARVLLLSTVVWASWSRAGVAIDSTLLAGGYGQSFDTLPASGTFAWTQGTRLPGWSAINSAGTFNPTASALDGTSNMADLLIGSVGVSGSGERALAYHTRLNTAPTYLGLEFNNNSGRELTSFALDYDAEQWRESGSARNLGFTVQYRVGGTLADLGAGTGWTTLAGLSASTLDGSVGASAALSSGVIGVGVPDGASLWFRWITTNTAASATSSNDILAIDNVHVVFTAEPVEAAPVITTDPAHLTVAVGETATFTVVASGNPAPTYQWFHGEELLEGFTSATLTLTNVQLVQAGDYTAVATNSLGADTSAVAVLTVGGSPVAPQITAEPTGATADAGSSLTLSVVATGTAPLAYQWFKDTIPLEGETAASLTLDPLTADSAGSYTVTVTNSTGSDTSAAAAVVVNLPPEITTPPAAQSAPVGGTVTFGVTVEGAPPFAYQWRKNGAPIAGAASATHVLSNIQVSDAAGYSVTVTNSVGTATSAVASLTVTAPPVVTLPPQSQSVLLAADLTLSVAAVGSGPFTYQWFHDGVPVAAATSASLTLGAAEFADAGSYRAEVTNAFGATSSAVATITVLPGLPDSAFNLTGFGRATTGGGIIAESDPAYRKVATPLEFAQAIKAPAGTVRVIEIMNDLDLGWIEVGAAVQAVGPFREHAAPKLHPRLIATGVSLIDIQNRNNLTIFSANGATIRHATWNIKSCNNIIIRNLRFDEMWEWDEATKGDYDANDWDFIDLGNSGVVYNVWIDHCTFTKAYDGISDIKKGSYNITFSWNKYVGDDGAANPSSFVRQQVAALEANRSAYPFYHFLRSNGFSVEDIVFIQQGHDKTHLIGATSFAAENAGHTLTFHHQWLMNPWDRLPRLRAGNVHNYNLLVDATLGRMAKRLRDQRAAAMSSTARSTLNNTYNFNVFLNGSISTEGGAVLVDKSVFLDCLTPLRNNQTDPSDPAYTGKILALDTLCRMTNDAGVATTVRGDSTDASNPMGPFQAPVIPFSWNLPGGVLPYAYTPDDPAELPAILERGAGAGRIVWPKSNWLKTTYPETLPAIPRQPESATVVVGAGVVFSPIVVSGAPVAYQWFKDDEPVPGATGPALTIESADADDEGAYTLVVTNSVGSVTSQPATLVVDPLPLGYDAWAAQWLAGADALASADPDGDAWVNLLEYALGRHPALADPLPPGPGGSGLQLLAVGAGSGDWAVRHTRNRQATGILMTVECSTDLLEWSALAVAPVVESRTAAQDSMILAFRSVAPRVFVRLRVTRTE